MTAPASEILMRNIKDFYLQLHKISERCFLDCVNDLSSRDIAQYELSCVEKCASKYIKSNNKTLQVTMELQPAIMQRRNDEANKQTGIEKINHEAEVKDT